MALACHPYIKQVSCQVAFQTYVAFVRQLEKNAMGASFPFVQLALTPLCNMFKINTLDSAGLGIMLQVKD